MKKIWFRLDCSSAYGLGHLKRCIALSEYMDDYEKVFFIRGDIYEFLNLFDHVTNYSIRLIKESIKLQDEINLIFNKESSSPESIIFDFSTKHTFNELNKLKEYFRAFKDSKTIVIDGLVKDSLLNRLDGLESYNIDGAVIPYVSRKRSWPSNMKVLEGPEYFIFNKVFFKEALVTKKIINEKVKNILITMGGSDPSCMTLKVLKAIINDPIVKDLTFNIVIGPCFPKDLVDEISAIATGKGNFILRNNVNSLVSWIKESDLCLAASGLTKYELACLNTPAILFSHNAQAVESGREFDDMGLFLHIGNIQTISDVTILNNFKKVINDFNLRKEMSEKSSILVDCNGVYRILDEFKNMLEVTNE